MPRRDAVAKRAAIIFYTEPLKFRFRQRIITPPLLRRSESLLQQGSAFDCRIRELAKRISRSPERSRGHQQCFNTRIPLRSRVLERRKNLLREHILRARSRSISSDELSFTRRNPLQCLQHGSLRSLQRSGYAGGSEDVLTH